MAHLIGKPAPAQTDVESKVLRGRLRAPGNLGQMHVLQKLEHFFNWIEQWEGGGLKVTGSQVVALMPKDLSLPPASAKNQPGLEFKFYARISIFQIKKL